VVSSEAFVSSLVGERTSTEVAWQCALAAWSQYEGCFGNPISLMSPMTLMGRSSA
jgi:hypothetical protein